MYYCNKYRETIWQNLPLKTKNKPKKKKKKKKNNTQTLKLITVWQTSYLEMNSEKLPLEIKKGTGMSTVAAAAAAAKSLQSCLTLCDPRDGSPPGSPVPGILQARTLE